MTCVIQSYHKQLSCLLYSALTSLPPGPLRSLQGHQLRVVSMEWFPFIDYKRSTPEGGAVVTPRDSLDYRMLQEISKRLNFTWVLRSCIAAAAAAMTVVVTLVVVVVEA